MSRRACDFFCKKVWTSTGLIEAYVLFFLHLGSRRIVHCAVTDHPGQVWMAQQARNLSILNAEAALPVRHLIRDRDSKFTAQFDDILQSSGVTVVPIQPLAPNMNAYAERFVQTIKQECLDHFWSSA